jgi:hypothetical protein
MPEAYATLRQRSTRRLFPAGSLSFLGMAALIGLAGYHKDKSFFLVRTRNRGGTQFTLARDNHVALR